jgi:hypothetical protein
MIRVYMVALGYALLAFFVERGILPQVTALLPESLAPLFDFRLLAMSGVLLGLLSGEIVGLLVAVFAALLLGFSQTPGYLGASLVSFSVAAWLGGMLTRHFRFQTFAFSAFWLFMLLFLERLAWMFVRWFFFRNTPITLGWGNLVALALTALLGGLLVKLIAPNLKRRMFRDEM